MDYRLHQYILFSLTHHFSETRFYGETLEKVLSPTNSMESSFLC